MRPGLRLSHAVKHITDYLSLLLTAVLLGCRSTPDPTDMPAWDQLNTVPVQTLTRQRVYAVAGKPLRETASEAYWESPSVKEGWPSSQTFVRKLRVSFDASGHAIAVRTSREQK
ncbi:hypothetical protein SBV1_1000020 [Verrucomicrobia bacterium]|nr:hypothetical protein SBV1_1000020 [Verrucomicrobiota bacterium]